MPRKSDNVHGDGWFTAAQAARLSGLTLVMLNYVCRTGIVEPSCSCKRGRGSTRHYSFGDVVALRLVAKLAGTGVQPLRLRKALQGLRELHPQFTLASMPAKYIVTDGTDLFLHNDGDAIERLRDGQMTFAFVVELHQLGADIETALRSTKAA